MAEWRIGVRPKFNTQYRHLDPQIKNRVDAALGELRNSTNPARIGVYKQNMNAFVYEVGRNYRVLYDVDSDERIIYLHRVCDHKSVYGRD